jgi:hypothetical protein
VNEGRLGGLEPGVRKVTGGVVFARRQAQVPPTPSSATTPRIVIVDRRFFDALAILSSRNLPERK